MTPWEQDSPRIDYYQCEIAPIKVINFVEVSQRMELLAGNVRHYVKGFRVSCSLSFPRGRAISTSQVNTLLNILSKKAIFSLCPWPFSKPDLSYRVKWVGGWDFSPIEGADLKLWTGSIKLEGVDILDQATY
ncbi:TPA: hypothetical protein DCX15_00785 [bacterium]|nr:hypothetical protein [bacterium]